MQVAEDLIEALFDVVRETSQDCVREGGSISQSCFFQMRQKLANIFGFQFAPVFFGQFDNKVLFHEIDSAIRHANYSLFAKGDVPLNMKCSAGFTKLWFESILSAVDNICREHEKYYL